MKRKLRSEIKELKGKYSKEELAFFSDRISQRIINDEIVKKSQFILAYHSLPDEVNTSALLDELRRMGKTVLLPVVKGENIELKEYEDECSLKQGAFKIWEPQGDSFLDFSKIQVALVPGVAFDEKGHRLGRGKGYYDKFLPKIPQAEKIGVCFPFQMVKSVPCDTFDIPMDRVITEI